MWVPSLLPGKKKKRLENKGWDLFPGIKTPKIKLISKQRDIS